jgi:hypothetical protein
VFSLATNTVLDPSVVAAQAARSVDIAALNAAAPEQAVTILDMCYELELAETGGAYSLLVFCAYVQLRVL